jgi:chemotaxis protein CheC
VTSAALYTEWQLDALRELSNVGSASAATALAQILGRPVRLAVPQARELPVADAIAALGSPNGYVTGVAMPVSGDLDAAVLLVFCPDDAVSLCRMLGVASDTEIGRSALGEIGNIVAAACVTALGELGGLELEPHPPVVRSARLGSLVGSLLGPGIAAADAALLLDSRLDGDGVSCSLLIVLVPESSAAR